MYAKFAFACISTLILINLVCGILTMIAKANLKLNILHQEHSVVLKKTIISINKFYQTTFYYSHVWKIIWIAIGFHFVTVQKVSRLKINVPLNYFIDENCLAVYQHTIYFLPVLHGEYSENFENESVAVKQVPTGSRRRLLNEK